MKYRCKNCGQTFENEAQAEIHKSKTGHRVELVVGSTYWGQHLVAP